MKNIKTGKFLRLLMVSSLALISVLCLYGCAPSLQLNQKYTHTGFHVQYGTPVSTDPGEYIDLSGLNAKEKKFVRDNTKIEYNGIKEPGKSYDKPGTYMLAIRYCGNLYRKYTVTVEDSIAPTFTRAQDVYTFAGLHDDVDFTKMFAAEDNVPGVKLRISSRNVNTDVAGNYTVTATATDAAGNTTKKSAVVHVQAPRYGAMGTYIYISIGSQQLTYFVNGQVDMSCSVVTGNVSSGHGTPSGVYRINSKSTDTRLKGQDYDVKVAYWMAFIGSSIGMHSAQWRSSFGGTQYMYNGSHGCVNMPTYAAGYIYNNAPIGTPVIVQ